MKDSCKLKFDRTKPSISKLTPVSARFMTRHAPLSHKKLPCSFCRNFHDRLNDNDNENYND